MMVGRMKLVGCIAAVAILMMPAAASANLLVNPGFEMPDASGGDTGPITGYFEFGAPGTRFVSQTVAPHSGLQTLKMFGPFDAIGGGTGIGQTLPASPGEFHTAEIWARNDSSDPIMGLNFAVAKIEYLDAGFGPVGGSFVAGVNVFETPLIDASLAMDTWTLFDVTSAPAPVGTAFVNYILVHVQLGDGAGGFVGGSVFMDDASLVVVPEPASLALMGFGGIALLWRRRRT